MPLWVWLPAVLLAVYHVVNGVRLFTGRMLHRRKAILITSAWIVLMQVALFISCFGVWRFDLEAGAATSIVTLQAVVALVLLITTVHTWRHLRPTTVKTPLTDRELPSLSVLVPARDETINLQNCLSALIASDYPKLEIIALDDCSSNRRTPEIIRGFAHDGVRFVQGNEPSHSMLPKNHAYARLVEEASSELLLFIGVDVIVEPNSLRRLVEAFLADKRDMISLLPMRPVREHRKVSFIQAMRYWWELGWPRRIFNRPPVLSTLWLIRAGTLRRFGGFAAAAQMITPEAYFARSLVGTDTYSFIRSTPNTVAIYSVKSIENQYETAIRVRYPQLHRRLHLVILTSFFELIFLIGPFVLLPTLLLNAHSYSHIVLNLTAVVSLSSMYYLIAIRTHLNNLWLGLLTAPVAFLLDIIMIHISMCTYEFGTVTWHDRRLNRPMLETIQRLPTPPSSLDNSLNER